MIINNVINLTISLIKSDLTNDSMKNGYIEFLQRFINQSNSIHEDEISLIRQEAKRLKIKIVDYNEEELEDILRNYQACKQRNTYSNSGYSQQNKKKLNTKSDNEKSEIERLHKIILDLKQKGKKAVASRDKWRKRAKIAERNQNEKSQNNDKKFKQVKKLFSKMYHPDSLIGDKFEKLIKQ
jgi:hypothetical protein